MVSSVDQLKFSTASELEIIQQILRGANATLPATTLQYLFDALRDLFTQSDPQELNQNLALARSIASQLQLLVGTGVEIPSGTFEKLVAAREMLQEGVQAETTSPSAPDERSTPTGQRVGVFARAAAEDDEAPRAAPQGEAPPTSHPRSGPRGAA